MAKPIRKVEGEVYNGDNSSDNPPLDMLKSTGRSMFRAGKKMAEVAINAAPFIATLGQIPMKPFRFSETKKKK